MNARLALPLLGMLLLAVSWGAFPLAAAGRQPQREHYDLLIRGGLVLDGTGNPERPADLGIRGDTLVAVGRLTGATAERVIDATGLMISPGFIDMHSHADGAFRGSNVANRRAPNLVTQGITTVVFGADGRSGWPISNEISSFSDPGIALNAVPMVGHGAIRSRGISGSANRAARPEELERMKSLLRQGLEEGAWGMGASPEYNPGRHSTTEELIELAKVIAEYDGFYYAHQRSEARMPVWQLPSQVTGPTVDGVDAVKETIRIATEGGVRAVGSHAKNKGISSWGRSYTDVMLAQLARTEGHQMFFDVYPYDTYGTGEATFPMWALQGGVEGLQRRLADPEERAKIELDQAYQIDLNGGADRMIIVDAVDEAVIGKTVRQVARERGVSDVQQMIDFALQSSQRLRQGVRIRPLAMRDEDFEHYLRQPFTAICTDAGVSTRTTHQPGLHPRTFGTYPRVIARYVRERGTVTLPHAVRAMSSLGAQIIGLPDRGYLLPGYKADVVIFDFEAIEDRATILEPVRRSVGIQHVLVNGEFLMDDGELTGALPGRVLNRAELKGNARVNAAAPAFPLQPTERGVTK